MDGWNRLLVRQMIDGWMDRLVDQWMCKWADGSNLLEQSESRRPGRQEAVHSPLEGDHLASSNRRTF